MLKQSILKRPTTAYLSVTDNNKNGESNDPDNRPSLKFSPANSTLNTQKNVRFSGIEQQKQPTAPNVPRPQTRSHRPSSVYVETNHDDYFELEKTQFPNEVGIKKYYKTSKSVPMKQIKLVGLNDEFIVASQPIQRHIQRELIQQQQQLIQQQRTQSSNKSKLRTTSARPFSDNYNRSIYPNLFRVAPNNNNPPPKAAVANNYNCYTFYNDQSNLYQQTSTTSSSRNNTGHSNQNQYYHWQGSDSGKSPNCESQASNSPAQNQNSLNQQHNRLLNISSAHQHQHQQQISGQIKSSLIKLNSKKSRKSSNLHGLFSPTSSTQSYGKYQTSSIASNENQLDTSVMSNGTLNGTLNSASQYSAHSHQHQPQSNYFQNQHSSFQAQTQSQISAQLAQSQIQPNKPPSSLTLYTYLLESNKTTSKDSKPGVIRSQTKKLNYEQVYMKNLVPKIQKLDIKKNKSSKHEQTNSTQTPDTPNSNTTAATTTTSIINPMNEMPTTIVHQPTKIKYSIFANNPARKNMKISNALENMKMTLRSESTNSYATS